MGAKQDRVLQSLEAVAEADPIKNLSRSIAEAEGDSETAVAGRRDAVRVLGALGVAALSALGRGDEGEAATNSSGEVISESERVVRKRHGKRGKRGRRGRRGPKGLAGNDFTVALVEATSDAFGDDIADPSSVTATADCGAPGLVVGGGYVVNPGENFPITDYAGYGAVSEVSADPTLQYFSATLVAFGGAPNLWGMSITAFAYCRSTD